MAIENDDGYREETLTLKMTLLLQEHGWDFNLSRDPVLILIEIEETLNNGDDES